jgi:hypothetical protein
LWLDDALSGELAKQDVTGGGVQEEEIVIRVKDVWIRCEKKVDRREMWWRRVVDRVGVRTQGEHPGYRYRDCRP